jgi:selenium metabolism protein YedF
MGMVVDARGLDCPQPVILTNKAFDEVDKLTTIVDNEVARENVSKLARSKGFSIEIEEKEGDFHLHLTRDESVIEQTFCSPFVTGPTVLLIASDSIGRGSEELGQNLMTTFVQVLHEIKPQPEVIIFMNSGVKLVAKGSKVVEDLRSFEDHGTELLACGTCLGYYDLKEKVAVGKISNMFEIASVLFSAGKIINP